MGVIFIMFDDFLIAWMYSYTSAFINDSLLKLSLSPICEQHIKYISNLTNQ